MKHALNRRSFLRKSATAGTGLLILRNSKLAFAYEANSKLNIAGIGVGGQGRGSLDAFHRLGNNLVAFCDVDAKRAGDIYQKHPAAKRYQDFRKMFDEMEKGIDAVLIATPDHTHAVAAVARGGLAHDARLVDGARQRLLAVDVFAQLHRRHGGDGVRVIGRGDQHGVYAFFHLVEHLAEVLIALRRRMFLIDVPCSFGIHIAERDEVVPQAMKRIETAAALTAHADAGNVQLAVRLVSEGQLAVAENKQSRTSGGGLTKKTAAVQGVFHG